MQTSTKKIATALFLLIFVFSFNVQAKSLKKQIKDAQKKLVLVQIEKQIEAAAAAPAGTEIPAPCEPAPTQAAPCPANQAPAYSQKVKTTISVVVANVAAVPAYEYIDRGTVYTCLGDIDGKPDKKTSGGYSTREYWIITMIRVQPGIDQNGVIVAKEYYLQDKYSVIVPRKRVNELKTPGTVFEIVSAGRTVGANSLKTLKDPYDYNKSYDFVDDEAEITASYWLPKM